MEGRNYNKMPFNQRLKIFEAIKGSTIHQSLATPSSEVKIFKWGHWADFIIIVPKNPYNGAS